MSQKKQARHITNCQVASRAKLYLQMAQPQTRLCRIEKKMQNKFSLKTGYKQSYFYNKQLFVKLKSFILDYHPFSFMGGTLDFTEAKLGRIFILRLHQEIAT